MPISFKKKTNSNGSYSKNTQQQTQNQNTQPQQKEQQKEYKEWSEKELLQKIYFLLRDIRDDLRSIRRNTYVADKEHNTFTSIAELLHSIDKKIE
jgi:esterase/lipase